MKLLHHPSGSPLQGDPTQWNQEGFVRHMVHAQGLKKRSECGRESTALNRARYVRQLMREGVRLMPPDEASWLDWVDLYLDAGGQMGSLEGHRQALLSLLAYLGLPAWSTLQRRFPKSYADWELVPDGAVVELTARTDLHPNRFLGEMIRAAYRFGFGTGVRPPSELVTLDLDHISIEKRRLQIWESKKSRWRTLQSVHPQIIDELAAYIDGPRAAVVSPGERAVFVTASGHRPSPTYLARMLRDAAQSVSPGFHCYQMRYWYATKRYLQTRDLGLVAREIGDSVATLERHYLHWITLDGEAPPHGVIPQVAVEA